MPTAASWLLHAIGFRMRTTRHTRATAKNGGAHRSAIFHLLARCPLTWPYRHVSCRAYLCGHRPASDERRAKWAMGARMRRSRHIQLRAWRCSMPSKSEGIATAKCLFMVCSRRWLLITAHDAHRASKRATSQASARHKMAKLSLSIRATKYAIGMNRHPRRSCS